MSKNFELQCDAYEIITRENIEDLKSEGILCRHKKTGARVVLMCNDDSNKVFYIGFRTTPKDSTGVMHILEHSVLCGSKDFPVKDPFIELAKGSLNTFLNAMTYPDKTVYPVASTNDKDFANLMHVYLDAVFYPNILNGDMTFKQEGWHYEMDSEEDELKINGVVYNEMKGAFSAPDDVLEREIFNSLFPDTTYGNESGGNPENIPDLTYEAYIDTYKQYYHPSNSYIYLYGDMDMNEKLKFMDEKYLKNFEAINVDSEVTMQKSFEKPIDVVKEYPITESEPTQNNTYLSYNVVTGTNLDPEEYIAWQMVDYALCTAPGAVLKQALLDKNIGKDVYNYYDNGVRQPYFCIVAKNSDLDKKEAFINTIEEVLTEVVRKGFDKDTLRAAVNAFEFRYREADFGSYPPGLMYGLQALDSWLYDDSKPFIHIKSGNVYQRLRERIDTDYFEKLVERAILNNSHKSVVTVVPKVGLAEENDKKLSMKLAAYKASLSPEEIKAIVENTAKLKEYQEEEDLPENLAKIPVLELADINPEAAAFFNEERTIGQYKALYHGIDTHGIDYIRLIFDVTDIPEELFPYIGILKNMMNLVDTANYSYGELYNKINICTGGIVPVCNMYTDRRNRDINKVTFEYKAKVLKGNIRAAFELLEEIIGTSVLDNDKRNYELFAEMKSHAQAELMNSGHQVAIGRIGTYFSKGAVLTDVVSGMSNYRLIEKIESDFDNYKKDLSSRLKQLAALLFRPERLMFDFAGEEEEYNDFIQYAKAFTDKLENGLCSSYSENSNSELCKPNNSELCKPYKPVPKVLNEGFTSASQVNYVCMGGNFIDKGLKYVGTLKVLRVMMSYDYLWMNVRVKNGAYGCMNSFGRSGDTFFVSYRDPNLAKTIDVYKGISEYLRQYDADEREMTQYIIGTVSELDSPLTPATKALRSLSAYMTNVTYEDIQRERDEVLSTGVEDIRAMAAYVDAALEDGYICVVGNEEAIRQEADRFDNLVNLV